MESKKNKPAMAFPLEWKGLKSSRFYKYRTWINKVEPGICGTYCSAVLVHDAVLNRYRRNLDKEELLKELRPGIDDHLPYRGTFYWDLVHGLKRFLRDFPEWEVKSALLSERVVPKILSGETPAPVIVGTASAFNSAYKNHWLVVYAYGCNEEGKLFYKAYDNHGRYKAIVPASQTFAAVWLEERNRDDGRE